MTYATSSLMTGFVMLFLSTSSFAFDPVKSCNKPLPLEKPISYFSAQSSQYVLATDTCMNDAFVALNMFQQELPAGGSYANQFVQEAGFSDRGFYVSKDLALYGTANSFMQEGELLEKVLGFDRVSSPESITAKIYVDDDLKWRFRVCDAGTPENPKIVSCLFLPRNLRMGF
ncbi:MAG TPA: hypothetical protein VN132_02830 [Bdellovibrio sp.]|nr:hypothetical protein [Bdellovibrio sp.]